MINFSGAVTGVQYGLAILILTFVCLFMIKRFLTTIRLWNRDRNNKNEDDGKTIDIFLCGAVDDSDLMNQLKLDFTNFGYITKVTTQSLIRQNELSGSDCSIYLIKIVNRINLLSNRSPW